jgi:hypothetical protein
MDDGEADVRYIGERLAQLYYLHACQEVLRGQPLEATVGDVHAVVTTRLEKGWIPQWWEECLPRMPAPVCLPLSRLAHS